MEEIDPGFTWCVNIVRQGTNVPAILVTDALLKMANQTILHYLAFVADQDQGGKKSINVCLILNIWNIFNNNFTHFLAHIIQTFDSCI